MRNNNFFQNKTINCRLKTTNQKFEEIRINLLLNSLKTFLKQTLLNNSMDQHVNNL